MKFDTSIHLGQSLFTRVYALSPYAGSLTYLWKNQWVLGMRHNTVEPHYDEVSRYRKKCSL